MHLWKEVKGLTLVNGGSTKECYRARQPYGFDCSEGEANGTARVTDKYANIVSLLALP
jgi:hypothetical protein